MLLALQLQDQDRLQESSAAQESDRDYALALQTQFNLGKSGTKSLQKMTEDEELAAALQAIESSPASGLNDFEFYKELQKRWEGKSAAERKKIEESVRSILDSPAVKGEYGADGTPILTDAHKYTSTLIRAGIPILTGIDDQFKLSSTELSPDKVLEEVLTFLEKDSKRIAESAKCNSDFLRISIENIKKTFGHVKSNPAVEASETQANAHHLLSRTWILAKKMGTDYMAALATALSDNIGDGGSCIPGLIARLYARYAVMLAAQLDVEGSPKPGAAKPAGK